MAARVNTLFVDLWTSTGDADLIPDSMNDTSMPLLLHMLADPATSKIALVGRAAIGKSYIQAFLAALTGTVVNLGAVDGEPLETLPGGLPVVKWVARGGHGFGLSPQKCQPFSAALSHAASGQKLNQVVSAAWI